MSNPTARPASSPVPRPVIVAWFAVVIGGWIVAQFFTDLDTLLVTFVGVVLLVPAQILWNRSSRR